MAYIDRDKVLKAVEKMDRLDKETKTKYEYDKKGFLLLINSAPTADVVEVKHGEWIYHECVSSYEGTINGYSCSVCSAFVNEEDFDTDEFHKIYCGNCGAKMDLKGGV